ncbi:hypothetical protein, partial [uncultured Victivallis sp.]|uniref:hypothetical protein n=1 Tax=uncultured Victivallis sp. TaxID=354118 RepID=UPI0025900604
CLFVFKKLRNIQVWSAEMNLRTPIAHHFYISGSGLRTPSWLTVRNVFSSQQKRFAGESLPF